MNINWPSNTKIIGCNLVPTPAQVAYLTPQNHAWTQLYLNWAATWSTFIKPQIDCMVGNNIGCNVVRIIGGNYGVINGQYSQQYYDSCTAQLATYLKALGVGFYAGACSIDNDTNYGVTAANLAASIVSSLNVILNTGVTVIGCDVVQEAQSGSIGTPYLIQLLTAIRQNNSNVPLTCSTSETLSNSAGATWINSIAANFDFIDAHMYYTPTIPQFDFLRTTFPTLDILVGEFGCSQNQSQDTQMAAYRAALSICTAADPKVRGGLVWAAGDQDTLNTNQFGVFDSNFAPKHTIANVLRQFTGGSLAKNLANHR
jgi:hypothetical protein